METWFTPASDNNPSNNRNEGNISEPSLPFKGHQVSKNSSEEGSGGTDGLIKGNGEKAQGDVPKDDGDAENERKSGDFEKLKTRSDGLHGNHFHPRNGYVTEQRTSRHVAHGQKDRVLEPVVA